MLLNLKINKFYKSIQGVIELQKGKVTLLSGANGSGKTTCFNYLKQNQQHFNSTTSIAFCSQASQPALPGFTAKNLLDLSVEFSRSSSNSVSLQKKLTGLFNFESKLITEVRKLSGGENQILKLITTLALDSEVIFLDEPFQYLDEKKSVILLNYLQTIKPLKSILMIEHKSDWPMDFIDRKYAVKNLSERTSEIYEL